MRAMVCERFGGPEVLALREVSDPPPPGPGRDSGAHRRSWCPIRGCADAGGQISVPARSRLSFPAARPPATLWQWDRTSSASSGDSVMSRHTLGACAELGNAKAVLCDKVPAGMTLAQAGVFRGAYTTAYHALLQRGRMRAGEWVLVHGAAGGIGIAAIQVAKAFGARVIATAGSDVKRAACLEEGADHAIDYRSGFVDAVKQLTGGRGVDIVYDPIGDKVAEESLRCLAWGGRLLILGFLGGGPTNIRSNYLLIKGIDAIGVRIGGLNEADPDLAIANMQALLALAEAGQAATADFPHVPSGSGARSASGGDRSRRDRQGGAARLSPARVRCG